MLQRFRAISYSITYASPSLSTCCMSVGVYGALVCALFTHRGMKSSSVFANSDRKHLDSAVTRSNWAV